MDAGTPATGSSGKKESPVVSHLPQPCPDLIPQVEPSHSHAYIGCRITAAAVSIGAALQARRPIMAYFHTRAYPAPASNRTGVGDTGGWEPCEDTAQKRGWVPFFFRS